MHVGDPPPQVVNNYLEWAHSIFSMSIVHTYNYIFAHMYKEGTGQNMRARKKTCLPLLYL